MNAPLARRRRQGGAIAIVFGLTLVVLLAMAGFVLDLGHLYIVKTELQNAADAAALAGAKELNQSGAGVDLAATQALKVASLNQYNFSTSLVLTDNDLAFGPTPTGPWVSHGAAAGAPQGMTFLKVDTSAATAAINTYLMRVMGSQFNTMTTSAVAVAGQFVNDITPLGVCAVDAAHSTAKYTYPAAPAGSGLSELVEFGFRRGVAYNLMAMGNIGGPSVPYLLNPVDTTATGCNASHSSAAFTAPFMCTGSAAILAGGAGQAYSNTGLTASLAASLNSRFDDYGGPSVCLPASAPPDGNVMEYPCKGGALGCVSNRGNAISTTPPINWMEPGASSLPSRMTALTDANKVPKYRLPAAGLPAGAGWDQFADYGVLWAYGPAYQASVSAPYSATAPFLPGDANLNPMYNATAINYFDTTAASKYPTTTGAGFPVGTPAAPYNQIGNPNYFSAPPTHPPGKVNRRILQVALVDCGAAPVGPPSCAVLTVVGIGKFFMLTKADFTGGTKQLNVEFAGLIKPVPNSEIRLYQ
jgi:Flp pilus assembly protein TadG